MGPQFRNDMITGTTGLPVRRSGFTLVEMLVVISVVALLLTLLLPSLSTARDKAIQTKCLAQIRGHALVVGGVYAADNKNLMPPIQGLSPAGQALRISNGVYGPLDQTYSGLYSTNPPCYNAGAPYAFKSQYASPDTGGYYDILLFELLYPDYYSNGNYDVGNIYKPNHLVPTAHCPGDYGTAAYPNTHGASGSALGLRQASYSLNGYISYPTFSSSASLGSSIYQNKLDRVATPSNKVAMLETHYQFAAWNSGYIANATSNYINGSVAQYAMVPYNFLVDSAALPTYSFSRHLNGFNSSYLDGSAKFIFLNNGPTPAVTYTPNGPQADPVSLPWELAGWYRPSYVTSNLGGGTAAQKAVAQDLEAGMFNIFSK